MKKPKVIWLDRRISAPGPYLCLCLSEQEFIAAMEHLKCKSSDTWITEGAGATTHIFTAKALANNYSRGLACVVCVSPADVTPIEMAGMLVHEAVHVWQYWCRDIGEKEPGEEQEAYAIQAISQELMAEFARRMADGSNA